MESTAFTEIVSTLGFPIACVIALGYFAFYMVKKTNEKAEEHMKQVQEDSKLREARLYEEVKENQAINAKFAEVISQCLNKLNGIETNVDVIKQDIVEIKSKIER